METDQRRTYPSADHPLLLGILVDVSFSMTKLMRAPTGHRPRGRLEGVRQSLDALVAHAAEYCTRDEDAKLVPKLNVFAYGFGFGSLLSRISGWNGSNVQDLLVLPGDTPSAVPLDQLAIRWAEYQTHVGAMVKHMFGDTPMLSAFNIARERFTEERRLRAWADRPVLVVISDGEPTDGTVEQVCAAAAAAKDAEILVITCLLADNASGDRKHLYGEPKIEWNQAARLMHQCASTLPDDAGSLYSTHMLEYGTYLLSRGWQIDLGARMFAQIDDPEALSEYLSLALARLSGRTYPVKSGQDPPEPDGLTSSEIEALASAYPNQSSATLLVVRAGLDLPVFPSFESSPSPKQYWTQIGFELALGRAVNGRQRLLGTAAQDFPANSVFQKWARKDEE